MALGEIIAIIRSWSLFNKRVKSKQESGFWILVRHPCPLIFGKALIESLEELADVVFIATSTR